MITRCDATASGAEAGAVIMALPSGRTLLLCQHHADQHWPALAAAGAVPLALLP